jgi:hypothetical protein
MRQNAKQITSDIRIKEFMEEDVQNATREVIVSADSKLNHYNP